MKRCSHCDELRAATEFSRNSSTADGLQKCFQRCMRAYQAAHYAKNREQHIARVRQDNLRRKRAAAAELEAYLRTHPCVDCATTDVRVLEFDHRPGEPKVANVSAMVGMGLPWGRILLEIGKCDVRCANCHRIATTSRGGHLRHAWSARATL